MVYQLSVFNVCDHRRLRKIQLAISYTLAASFLLLSKSASGGCCVPGEKSGYRINISLHMDIGNECMWNTNGGVLCWSSIDGI